MIDTKPTFATDMTATDKGVEHTPTVDERMSLPTPSLATAYDPLDNEYEAIPAPKAKTAKTAAKDAEDEPFDPLDNDYGPLPEGSRAEEKKEGGEDERELTSRAWERAQARTTVAPLPSVF